MNNVSLEDTSLDRNNPKVTFNQSVNVKYASNPTISTSLNSLPNSSLSSTIPNSTTPNSTNPNSTNKLTSSSNRPKSTSNQLSINKLSSKQTTNSSNPSLIKQLKSSNLVNQLKQLKLNTTNQQSKRSELNKISNHNQVQALARKMRTISTASEKNAEFKSKYGLNKTSTNSLLNKPAKTKPGTVVDEKVIVSHKGTFDSGPVLASTTVNKSIDHYKLPFGRGENIEKDEFGEQVWKHKNVRAYEEKTKRKVRQEFDVPASAVVKKLNESTKLDKNNNKQATNNDLSVAAAKKKYIYGMDSSGGGIESGSQALAVLHSNNNNSLNHSPFKDNTTRISSSGKFMVDKAIQCELKKSKLKETRNFSETGWKYYVEEPEEPKFREYSSDKWYYDKYEFEPGELVPETSRQIEGIGENHQVHKWTKKINPSSVEQKVETEKKVNTEYKHNLTGSFKVIRPNKNGTVTTYSNVKPLTNKNLGLNSAGQQVLGKSGEVIYSQVDKSKKRVLRDQMRTPLPGYPDEDSDYELELKKQSDIERPRSELKSNRHLSSRSPSPVSRSRMICLNIPTQKSKSRIERERSLSPQLMRDHLPPRSSSTGAPRVVRNRTYQLGYGNAGADPIEPPPQFATLGNNRLPPKAPISSLHRSSSSANQVRRIPIEADSKWYYQTEQSNLSDQSSVFALKKDRATLEETMSFASSGSEFVDNKELDHCRIPDSTIRELDKKKKQISYDNQVIRHSNVETPMANSVWYKSLDEDYRKGMASNEIRLPSLPTYNNENYFATMGKKKSSSSSKKDSSAEQRQAYTLDKRYLEERKKKSGLLTSSSDKENKVKSSLITRRPTQQASDFMDSKVKSSRQFSSTRDLSQQQSLDTQKRSSSLTRYNESESDASNHMQPSSQRLRSGYRAFSGLNYPLRPVTRSASMHNPTGGMLNHPSSLLRKHQAIRSTESDHGYSGNRPTSRASSTTRFSTTGQPLIQNDEIVLYLPAVDNSSKEITNTLIKTKSGKTAIGNKKLASSVNNLSSVSRTNSILSKMKTPSSKKDLSKSTDKLNEVTAKLNNYQNSKTLANKMSKSKETSIKRSHSMPNTAKSTLLTKLKNKLKSKD